MNITLDHLMPVPLASIKHGADSVWGNQIELTAGKRILLNASSGKGKSTFTTTVYGLRNDYEGTLRYGDDDIRKFSPNRWTDIRKHQVSAVFQDLQLFPKLTLGENLILKNSLTDMYTESELKNQLEQLEMDGKWQQLCGLLSMGQQQRVAVIRALAQPFEWLLMDEPFSHLDVENAKRCMDMIHIRTVEQNAGFVLTTLGDSHGYKFDQELKL
jgi:ABC-type lipoprotein export system ATPase subunit